LGEVVNTIVIRNRRQDRIIEKRGYVWQCAMPADKERYLAIEANAPCGHWNAYFGIRWACGKNAKWQPKCTSPNCKRKRQLNLGNVLPEAPNYYATKEAALKKAAELNTLVRVIGEVKKETVRWLD